MMKNRYLTLLSDTAVFAVGNLVVKLIQFFLVPLYTTAMTTAEYGIGELSNNLTEMLCPMITLSVYMALFRFALDEESDKTKLFSSASALLLGGVFVAVLAGMAAEFFSGYAYVWPPVLVLISAAVYMTLSYFARGTAGARAYVAASVINAVVLCASNAVLLVYLRTGSIGYLYSIAIANLTSSLFLVLRIKAWRFMKVSGVCGGTIRAMLRLSIPMMFTTVAWWFITMPGRYILLWHAGESEAGILAAASKLPAVIIVLANTFQMAWQIAASKERNSADSMLFFSKVLKFYSAAVLAIASIIICLTPLMTKLLLKGSFAVASPYLPLLMLSAVLHCYSTYYGTIYIAYKDTKMAMGSTLAGAIMNLALGVILIPAFGIRGSVIAIIAGYVVIDAIRMIDTRRFIVVNLLPGMTIPCLAFVCAQSIFGVYDTGYNLLSVCCCAATLLVLGRFLKGDLSAMYEMLFQRKRGKQN